MNTPKVSSENKSPIRVLVVEDMPWDFELVRHELLRSGLDCVAHRVEAEPEFRRELTDFVPDIILADHELPRFSGMRALEIAQELVPDTPLILVSGAVTEDVAIQSLEAGAIDYLLKDNLLRLGPAVEAALHRARLQRKRREAETERASLEHRLSAFADSTADAMIIADQEQNVRFWNQAAASMFGFSMDEMLSQPLLAIVPRRLRARHQAALEAALAGGSVKNRSPVTTVGLHQDDTEFPIELTLGSWAEGEERFVSAVVRDVTERVNAERERTLLGAAVEQSTNLVVITDTEGVIQYVNAAFEAITGFSREEAVGQGQEWLRNPGRPAQVHDEMWAEVTAGRSWSGELANRRQDGTEFHQRTTIFPIQDAEGRTQSFVGIGEDVTKEIALQSQLRQAQKMEVVGHLTGGIAHDFNNVLAAVLTNAQLLSMTLPPDLVEEKAQAEDIEFAARRGADLIKRLMAFSRDQQLDLEVVDPSEVLQGTVTLLKRVIPESIELILEEAHNGALITVDRSGIQQILLNLATNARDAMPDGGTLAISTAASEHRVEITVRDTGVGMDAAILERAFDPFFTTKEEGEGTGLGLAMVRALVERHEGTIEAVSDPGVGTTFVVGLPLADSGEQPTRKRQAVQTASDVHSGKTVLFVEDEAPLRRVGERILERFGYRVVLADNGRHALEILKARGPEISLVVTDLIMPEVGGVELYEATKDWETRPAFLATSGYSPSERGGGIMQEDGVPFLRKPWDAMELLAAVESALDDADASELAG